MSDFEEYIRQGEPEKRKRVCFGERQQACRKLTDKIDNV
jgi:hypothetical protein